MCFVCFYLFFLPFLFPVNVFFISLIACIKKSTLNDGTEIHSVIEKVQRDIKFIKNIWHMEIHIQSLNHTIDSARYIE